MAPAWVIFEPEQEKTGNEDLFIGANLYLGVWLNGKHIIDLLCDDRYTGSVMIPMQAGKKPFCSPRRCRR